MKKPFRILIALAAGIASLVLSIVIYLLMFEEGEASTFGAATAVAVMFFTYRNFSSPKNELLKQNTKLVEEFHANGITRERGKLIYGKKDGEWEYYNEKGELIREDIYSDGHLMRSIDHAVYAASL